jgi:hypothetical protein
MRGRSYLQRIAGVQMSGPALRPARSPFQRGAAHGLEGPCFVAAEGHAPPVVVQVGSVPAPDGTPVAPTAREVMDPIVPASTERWAPPANAESAPPVQAAAGPGDRLAQPVRANGAAEMQEAPPARRQVSIEPRLPAADTSAEASGPFDVATPAAKTASIEPSARRGDSHGTGRGATAFVVTNPVRAAVPDPAARASPVAQAETGRPVAIKPSDQGVPPPSIVDDRADLPPAREKPLLAVRLEPPASPLPRLQKPDGGQAVGVRIGSLEVRVVPPAQPERPPMRPAAPARPSGSLARGFGAFGLVQG